MPLNIPALIGIWLLLSPVIQTYAAEAPKETVKYQNCLEEQRERQKSERAAECSELRTEAAIAACYDRLPPGIIQYCKLTSGVIQSSSPNNIQEAQRAAELQNKREIGLGIEPDPNPPATNLPVFSPPFQQSEQVSRLSEKKFDVTDGKATLSTSHRASIDRSKPGTTTSESKSTAQTGSPNRGDNATTSNTSKLNETANTSRDQNASISSTRSSSFANDPSSAQAEASADLARCEQAQSAATRCCNNPLSCASSSEQATLRQLGSLANSGDTAGMVDYCRQMETLGDSSGNINTRLGAICTNNHYACSNTCSRLESKYRSLMASCENCDSYSIYSSTASALASYRSMCAQLSARADALVNQGLSTASSSAGGDYCQRLAAASPQASGAAGIPPAQSSAYSGYGGARPGDPYGCAANPNQPACVDCNRFPNNAACVRGSSSGRGEAGFKSRQAAEQQTKFNIADNSGEAGAAPLNQGRDPADPLPVRTIPNNTGGGLQGGDGAQAQLGASSRRGTDPSGSRSYTTDVDQGFRSGGYSAPVGNNEVFPMSYGQQPRPKSAAAEANPGSQYLGMDLKQYLPGGSRDPGRRIAGTGRMNEINAKEEDIFRRISIKIYEKCRLGILWRCN